MMPLVIGLIVIINVVVLGLVSPLGWPPVLIGAFGAIYLTYVYLHVCLLQSSGVNRNLWGE